MLGVLLAAVGIFGLVHYAVAERTREMGVRIAMGATAAQVMALVIRQGMRMPLAGIAAGLLAAAGVTRVMSGLLFGVGAIDLVTFAVVAGLLALVALTACYLPARRASRIDPMLALRQD
jgi:putative ABC transport system permease protein